MANTFNDGIEKAASWHDQRAEFTRQRREHLKSNPGNTPLDIFEDLLEKYQESIEQDLYDAKYLRTMKRHD